ncbi:methyl-accepting chemotaxis protein [Kiloniella laminariae]|uniref:Methyl-accepting chemotaxis protein n=1 Tax=Kiloniella laminariae TaxID=454162 RepID=A0ABT4LF64_9PROT|nr:methyl-accepting chemotaxis protein [Kiloniella laminariae]MCZ4279746.1 methyl-accepting chemotaxis protein [Kiloniella laminariae]
MNRSGILEPGKAMVHANLDNYPDMAAENASPALYSKAHLIACRAACHARRDLHTLGDALQGEFEGTMSQAQKAGETMTAASEETRQALNDVAERSRQLEVDAETATQNVDAVAAATEEMNASIALVGDHVAKTAEGAKGASAEATQAAETIQTLASASERIGSVVRLIEGIAGQTNLLALNATIEAARAGDAGKGFAVVASEVKSLAQQTAKATQDITAQIEEIQQVTRLAVEAISSITKVIGEVEDFSSEVADRVQEQVAAVNEIGRNAQQAAVSTRQVTATMAHVVGQVNHVTETTTRHQDSAHSLHELVEALNLRLQTAVRSSYAPAAAEPAKTNSETYDKNGDKNGDKTAAVAAAFVPFDLDCRLTIPGLPGFVDSRLRQMTASGGQLFFDGSPQNSAASADNIVPEVNREVSLNLLPLGDFAARITAVSPTGCSFDFSTPAQSAITALLDGNIAIDQPFIARCIRSARRISTRFEQAVDQGEISLEDLFDRDYQAVEDSNPLQHLTRYLPLTDKLLPEFQETVLDFDSRVAFCAAVDVNGYLPTHNLKYNHPQRPNDPVWNAGNCRNRRIFTDRTGAAAGANTAPYLLQSYLRDMGGGNFILMKDLSAPITVHGKQWGNLRLGYSPT